MYNIIIYLLYSNILYVLEGDDFEDVGVILFGVHGIHWFWHFSSNSETKLRYQGFNHGDHGLLPRQIRMGSLSKGDRSDSQLVSERSKDIQIFIKAIIQLIKSIESS